MKKQDIPISEEEINSLMRELKTIEIEDMADRAKIIERSNMLEKRDEADLTELMARGGKISHKKGGGFTYNIDGKKRVMSEYMKDLLGGREMLEENFQGGGSIQDIMLMNINPMTARGGAQQPMMGGGHARKRYQTKGELNIQDTPMSLTDQLLASIENKQIQNIPIKGEFIGPHNVDPLTKEILDTSEFQGPKEDPNKKSGETLEIDYTIDPDTGEPFNKNTTKKSTELKPYKETVLQEHADMYSMDTENMKWNENKQQWVPKDGAVSKDGDTWIEDLTGDNPDQMEGGWLDDAKNYEYDSRGNIIREVTPNRTMSQLQGRFETTGEKPTYEEWITAWQIENPDVPMNKLPSEESFNNMWSGEVDPSQLPIDDPLHPDYMSNKYPRVTDDGSDPNVDITTLDRNNNNMPDYLERQPQLEPITIENKEITDYFNRNRTDIEPILSQVDVPEDIANYTPGPGVDEQAAERYGYTLDNNEFLEDGVTPNPNYGEYTKTNAQGEVDVMAWNDDLGIWQPGWAQNLPPAPKHQPKQTIRELLEGMNIKKNLPSTLGGLGTAISGIGPLATTLKQGIDTDEINYFENIEDAAIEDQEKGLDVFDRGKEEARRVIDRERRQGIRRLQDYVQSAPSRRAHEAALDVAGMEQIPLSDLRFDTAKSQLYNQIARTRLQGDVYDATGATARDDKLDQNRDAYYSALSENLANLGTQTQSFARNINQERANKLMEMNMLNTMDNSLDQYIWNPDLGLTGGWEINPNYIGQGPKKDDKKNDTEQSS